jgi:alpha-D-ribose 1-methylphosphonate 5-phosphate C-P lyase
MKPASPPARLRDLAAPRAGYTYGFLDAAAKREIRRRLLKAVALPGHQVPYASRELPIARGWGTGGLQVTLSLVGPGDVLKVIDQGADDSVNAANLRRFVVRMTGVRTTTDALAATLIQSRHRIPEEILAAGQVLVLQVPDPEPLRGVQSNSSVARRMHGMQDYGLMWLKLYEQLVRYGRFVQGASYPVQVHGRYIMSPSPIPRWDTPKLHQAAHLTLLSAGREKRLYAVPPWTDVKPLEFTDRFFQVEEQSAWACRATGMRHQFLNELPLPDGGMAHELSDTGLLHKFLGAQGGGPPPGPTYYDASGRFYHPGFLRQSPHA